MRCSFQEALKEGREEECEEVSPWILSADCRNNRACSKFLALLGKITEPWLLKSFNKYLCLNVTLVLLVVGEDTKEDYKDFMAHFDFNHEYIHTVSLSSRGCGRDGGWGTEERRRVEAHLNKAEFSLYSNSLLCGCSFWGRQNPNDLGEILTIMKARQGLEPAEQVQCPSPTSKWTACSESVHIIHVVPSPQDP